MRLRLVKIDETNYLSDQAKAECGRYGTIYLYDADQPTHCCEITTSYWLEAVFFETEKRIEDELYYDLQLALYDSCHYRHCGDTERLPTMTVIDDFEDFEDAREHFQCNCWFAQDEVAA